MIELIDGAERSFGFVPLAMALSITIGGDGGRDGEDDCIEAVAREGKGGEKQLSWNGSIISK